MKWSEFKKEHNVGKVICQDCGKEGDSPSDVHRYWWDCPAVRTTRTFFGKEKKGKANYGFIVKGGTPKFHG